MSVFVKVEAADTAPTGHRPLAGPYYINLDRLEYVRQRDCGCEHWAIAGGDCLFVRPGEFVRVMAELSDDVYDDDDETPDYSDLSPDEW